MEDGILKDLMEGKNYPTDLFFVMFISIFGTLSSLILPDGSILRIIFGIPMLIFLPGYSLVSVFWPGRHQSKIEAEDAHIRKGLDSIERIIFSIGLSIALVSLTGLILNYISTITLIPILTSLLAFTLTCSILAIYLRKSLHSEERYQISFMFLLKSETAEKASVDKVFTILLICSIIVFTSIFGYMVLNPVDNSHYTEFYILDQNHTLEILPNNLTVNETGTIIITIHNLENEMIDYTIIAGLENDTFSPIYSESNPQIELDMNHYSATNISLDDSTIYEQEYSFKFSTPGRYKIVWTLLVNDVETNYQLHMWVNVT